MSSLEPPLTAEVRTKAIVRPSGENEASCSSPAEAAIAGGGPGEKGVGRPGGENGGSVPPPGGGGVGGGGPAVGAARKEAPRAAGGALPLEEDEAAGRRDERPRVDLGAAGQPFLAGAVG